MKKKLAIFIAVILLIGVAYYLITSFCAWCFFKNKVTFNNYTFFSNHSISSDDVKQVVLNTEEGLKKCEFYNCELIGNPEIYIFNNSNLYNFFVWYDTDSLAGVTITTKVYVSKADIKNDLIINPTTKRSVSTVLLHELTHSMIKNKYGLIKSYQIPFDISEGYPEYIAKASSFDVSKGINLIKNNQNDDSIRFKYLKARLKMVYLLDIKKYKISNLIKNGIPENNIDSELRNNIQEIETMIKKK